MKNRKESNWRVKKENRGKEKRGWSERRKKKKKDSGKEESDG